MSDSARNIKDTANELYIILINRTGRSTTEFLSLLIDKNNVLENYLNIFTSDWKNYREKSFLVLFLTFVKIRISAKISVRYLKQSKRHI